LLHGSHRYGCRGILTYYAETLVISNALENLSILTACPFGVQPCQRQCRHTVREGRPAREAGPARLGASTARRVAGLVAPVV